MPLVRITSNPYWHQSHRLKADHLDDLVSSPASRPKGQPRGDIERTPIRYKTAHSDHYASIPQTCSSLAQSTPLRPLRPLRHPVRSTCIPTRNLPDAFSAALQTCSTCRTCFVRSPTPSVDPSNVPVRTVQGAGKVRSSSLFNSPVLGTT